MSEHNCHIPVGDEAAAKPLPDPFPANVAELDFVDSGPFAEAGSL